jgi:hypothetical protein
LGFTAGLLDYDPLVKRVEGLEPAGTHSLKPGKQDHSTVQRHAEDSTLGDQGDLRKETPFPNRRSEFWKPGLKATASVFLTNQKNRTA